MDRKKSKRPKPGDIGRVEVNEGSWARLYYLGRHEFLGESVLIDPNLENNSGEKFSNNYMRSYISFYFFSAFVKDGLVEVIDHCLPPMTVPLITRSPQRIGNGPWKSWIIIDPTGKRNLRDTLTEEEIEIPRRLIVSHQTLLNRLRRGWQPRDDVVYEDSLDGSGESCC